MGLIKRSQAVHNQITESPMMQVAGQNHDGKSLLVQRKFVPKPVQPVTFLGAAHNPITTPVPAMTETSATRQATLPPFMV
jgi:hypothetical protein